MIKKILTTIIILFLIPNSAFAANTHSIDVELSSSQYLSITDANQTGLAITGDISVEAWISVEQLPSTSGTTFGIIGKWAGAGGNRSYYMYMLKTDVLVFVIDSTGAGNFTEFRSDAAVVSGGDVGNWVHVAVTVDVSGPTMAFYKDGSGIAESSVSTNATSIADKAAAFTIGAQGAPAQYFDGKIDEVRVWNDIRTSGEISANYNKEISGASAGLAGYWQLNNDLLDQTSNNNDLTNNNSAVFSTDVPFSGAVPRRIFITN